MSESFGEQCRRTAREASRAADNPVIAQRMANLRKEIAELRAGLAEAAKREKALKRKLQRALRRIPEVRT